MQVQGTANSKHSFQYGQTLRKQTPLGPSIAVRLRGVSAYRRLKNKNTIGGRVWQACLLITECEWVRHKNVITVQLILRSLL